MAHNEYYAYKKGTVSGDIMMNVQVFDDIVKRAVNTIDMVAIDFSKGVPIPGTKRTVSCSIKDNDVYVTIHVNLKYGANVTVVTKEVQTKIALAIKEVTGVQVKNIDVNVDNIIFD